MPYEIIEPGSLDIEQIMPVRVGGMRDCGREALIEGRKFIVIEDQGEFTEADLDMTAWQPFDYRTQQYSILVGPAKESGRHAGIPSKHRRKISAIVGGGIVKIIPVNAKNMLLLEDYSAIYDAEPDFLRHQFAVKLLALLRLEPGFEELELSPDQGTDYYQLNTNPYWQRYDKVHAAAKAIPPPMSIHVDGQLKTFEWGQRRLAEMVADSEKQKK